MRLVGPDAGVLDIVVGFVGFAGAIAAAAALIVAIKANGIARKGNKVAKTATRPPPTRSLKRETLTASRRMRTISQPTPTQSLMALRISQDDVPYNWLLDVTDEGVATVKNDCAHNATQVIDGHLWFNFARACGDQRARAFHLNHADAANIHRCKAFKEAERRRVDAQLARSFKNG